MPRVIRRTNLALAVLLTATCTTAAFAAENEKKKTTAERLGADVKFLASDEMEGRGVGTDGLLKAAEFVRDEFQRLGLKPGGTDGSFYQTFQLPYGTKVAEGANTVVLNGPDGRKIELELGKQFQPIAAGGSGKVDAEIVFAGYGISAKDKGYDDFADVDVKGKVIVVIRKEPQQNDEKSAFDGKRTTSHSFIQTKVKQAGDHGAAGILFVNDPTSTAGGKDELVEPNGFGSTNAKIPFAFVKQSVVDELLKAAPLTAGETKIDSLAAAEQQIDTAFAPITQPITGWSAAMQTKFDRQIDDVHNVIAILEGDGPLADETVIVGAHYDHLGFGPQGSRAPKRAGEVHNGADDNATGTAAIMEIARRFAEREEKPARRVVFIAFGGEERGLLGSDYYVKNPIIPLEKTVAMINFDMIGQLRNNKLTVMGAGTAKEFGDLLDRVNENGHGFTLAKQASGAGGSDQAKFVRKEIPVLFFFTGTTKQYHTPDDDFETLNIPGLAKVVEYAHAVTVEVVAAETKPTYVAVRSGGGARGGQMAYLGVSPDYTSETVGLKVNGVNKDSPAEKGGLKEGDVITKFGDVPVADIRGLAEGLRKYKGGQKVEVVYKRDGKEAKTSITLEAPRGGR